MMEMELKAVWHAQQASFAGNSLVMNLLRKMLSGSTCGESGSVKPSLECRVIYCPLDLIRGHIVPAIAKLDLKAQFANHVQLGKSVRPVHHPAIHAMWERSLQQIRIPASLVLRENMPPI